MTLAMRNFLPAAVLWMALTGLSGAASLAAAAEMNVPYGPDPSQRLDVCTPEPIRPGSPAVLMIHGGGWTGGNRSGLTNGACKTFAQAGIVAIPVDYRLATKAPRSKWPAQFNDVQLAMRWVRAHAGQFGINPNHICAEGDSAGGQLALLLDVVYTIEPGDMQDMLATISPRANCAISLSGPSDLVSIDSAHPGYANFLIGKPDPGYLRQQKELGSPALRVRKGAGPVLLIHGLDDPFVPFAQAVEMQAALARVGTPVWLASHQGGHELQGLSPRQGGEAFSLIGDFVKSPRLPGPPRQFPIEQILR